MTDKSTEGQGTGNTPPLIPPQEGLQQVRSQERRRKKYAFRSLLAIGTALLLIGGVWCGQKACNRGEEEDEIPPQSTIVAPPKKADVDSTPSEEHLEGTGGGSPSPETDNALPYQDSDCSIPGALGKPPAPSGP